VWLDQDSDVEFLSVFVQPSVCDDEFEHRIRNTENTIWLIQQLFDDAGIDYNLSFIHGGDDGCSGDINMSMKAIRKAKFKPVCPECGKSIPKSDMFQPDYHFDETALHGVPIGMIVMENASGWPQCFATYPADADEERIKQAKKAASRGLQKNKEYVAKKSMHSGQQQASSGGTDGDVPF